MKSLFNRYFLGILPLLMLLICVCGCTGSKQTATTNNDFPGAPNDSLVASLYRTPCFGVCPHYRVSFYRSGYVEYEGFANAALKGRYFTYIKTSELKNIGVKAEEIGYFELNDTYRNPHLTDFPTIYSEVRFRGKQKKITRYDADPPKNLVEMENYIDKMVPDSSQFIVHPNQDMKQ